MIADTLGWELDEIRVEQVESVFLDRDAESDAIKVPKGYNAGSKQMAYGVKDGRAVITTDFKAYIGAPEEYDSVTVKGVPPISQRISPCVHGAIAITANMIPRVISAEPGFKTMVDLPMPHATPKHMRKYIK